MWGLLGITLLVVSILLTWAPLGLPGSHTIKSFISNTFFRGDDIYAKNFRFEHELTWLQAPAAVTGLLEWMPASGLLHALEIVVFLGLYFWTKQRKLSI